MNDRLNLLISLSGEPIKTVEDWEAFRRPELISLLENYVYGVRPYETPEKLTFSEVRKEKNWFDSNATFKENDICVKDHPFPV